MVHNPPLCIGFDGRKDRVNFFTIIDEVRHPDATIEEHIVMTKEPGSRLLTFFSQ